MYYSNGNYEAFARPKNLNMLHKICLSYWLWISIFSCCMFLIRDGQMDGSNIHILEELSKSGGSLDGTELPMKGYVRGGREMENHFECLWDLFRPSHHLKLKMLQF